MSETELVDCTDADFAWIIRGVPACHAERGLALPPGGVDHPAVVAHVRAIARRLRERDCHGAWMIVAGGEIVGMCGYKDPPSASGEVEIGYGIAASRRRRGHATAAVRLILAAAGGDAAIQAVLADTLVDNAISQRVLMKNGFERTGEHLDPADGAVLIRWRKRTQPLTAP